MIDPDDDDFDPLDYIDDEAPILDDEDLNPQPKSVDEESEFETVEYDEEEDQRPASNVSVNATERMLLAYLNNNHQLWIRCAPILEAEYFSSDMRPVVQMIKDFERKNQKLPDAQVVLADTGVSLECPSDATDEVVMDDISERVETFCRHQAAQNYLLDAAETLDEDRSRATMAHLLRGMEDIVKISVKQDLGYEVHRDAEHLLQVAEKSDGLPTGFPLIDESLNGGVTNPSYNLVSAASGQGKSIMLQNLSVNYARQGYNVIYISLELPEFMIQKRFSAMMTNTHIGKIYDNMDRVLTKLRMDGRTEGDIRIKRMSMTGTTVADIKAYANELKAETGKEWTHFMLDYPDLMAPMRPGIRIDNLHMKDQAISEEIYEWTHEKGSTKTVWGASQQVKGAKDEKEARQSGVAGGVGKVHTCDNLLILKRTREDIQDERAWVFIEKGRNGGQGIRVPLHWDSGTQRMSSEENLRDIYDEMNNPSAQPDEEETKSKPSRFKDDPLKRAKTESETEGGKKAIANANRIRSRFKREKP